MLSAAAMAVGLLGLAGLSVDIGRMYVAKSEAQVYTDAAAVGAALELDGTSTGIANAIDVVGQNTAKWNFNTRSFTNTTVDFATSSAGPWSPNPNPAANYGYARVRTSVDVSLYLLPIVIARRTAAVGASSVAAQVPKYGFNEGVFPFSPIAHNNTPPDFGLVKGQDYTLRWASNPHLGSPNVCAGDNTQQMIDLAQAQGGAERGFIEETSASTIRATIVDDYQTVFREIGDLVDMTGGAKQTELTALQTRISQDDDPTSMTFAEYHGNGRRIILAPINDGGTPPGANNRIVQFGAFFLRPTGNYGNGGAQSWCAEYIGAWVEGTNHKGAGNAGAYVVRLVE